MFGPVAAFELRYQLKSPAFWVTFAIFLLLTFAATASDNVHIGSGGNVWKNSPFAIAQTLMIMTVFSIFILTAFVANVVVRDDETGLRADHPLDAHLALRLPVRPLHRRVPRRLPAVPERAARHDDRRRDAVAGSRDARAVQPRALRLRLPAALRADAVRDGRRLLRDRHRHALDDVDLCRRRSCSWCSTSWRRSFLSRPEFIDTPSRWSIRSALGAYDQATRTGRPPSATRSCPTSPATCSGTALLWARHRVRAARAWPGRSIRARRRAVAGAPRPRRPDRPTTRGAAAARSRRGAGRTRCRSGDAGWSQLWALATIRHGRRRPQPGLHRAARHRLR